MISCVFFAIGSFLCYYFNIVIFWYHMKFKWKFTHRALMKYYTHIFHQKKHTSLRSKLLMIVGVISLFISGLTFAVGWVGAAITWPSTPAWEASGGTIMSYFRNAFGDASTQTQKICTNSGVIRWFRVDGTPVCASLSELSLSPSITALSGTSLSIVLWGSTTITWNASNATSCSASSNPNTSQWSGIKSLSWSQVVTPSVTTTYTLTCTGSGGTATQSVTVTVQNPPSITALSGTSLSIVLWGSTTITWNASNATSCSASSNPNTSQWSGIKSLSWSQVVTPSVTTTYTLTCTGSGGTATQSVTVTVQNPPSITALSGTSLSIVLWGSTTITWNASNATSCSASSNPNTSQWSGIKSLSWSQVVTPSVTTTYTLTCTGSGGTATQSVTINVTTPSPSILFSSSNTGTVLAWSSLNLSWNASNATSCSASSNPNTSQWSGIKSLSWSQVVTPSVTTTYTLTCTGSGGTATQSVTVSIQQLNAPSQATVIQYGSCIWLRDYYQNAGYTPDQVLIKRSINGWIFSTIATLNYPIVNRRDQDGVNGYTLWWTEWTSYYDTWLQHSSNYQYKISLIKNGIESPDSPISSTTFYNDYRNSNYDNSSTSYNAIVDFNTWSTYAYGWYGRLPDGAWDPNGQNLAIYWRGICWAKSYRVYLVTPTSNKILILEKEFQKNNVHYSEYVYGVLDRFSLSPGQYQLLISPVDINNIEGVASSPLNVNLVY
jgi:uncharacterized membrane protein